jgi:hypothetical protein
MMSFSSARKYLPEPGSRRTQNMGLSTKSSLQWEMAKGGYHMPEIVQLVQEEAPSSLTLREFDLGTAVKYSTD